MKIQPAELAKLASALAPLDTMDRRCRYRQGDYLNAAKTVDVDKRYRWDLWWSTPWTLRDEIINSLGGSPKDDWIDTALRRLVAPL